MNWHSRRDAKQARLMSAEAFIKGKAVVTGDIAKVLTAVMRPGDRVILEGDNQKQATFLAKALTEVDPKKVNDVTMLIPSVSRDEHLDVFDRKSVPSIPTLNSIPDSLSILPPTSALWPPRRQTATATSIRVTVRKTRRPWWKRPLLTRVLWWCR